jgi:DNA-binding transcriptional regulator YiaG
LDAAQAELVQIRQQLGMTQEAFAEALGVHPDTISRWERGERGVSQMALKLARSILASP